MNIKIKSFLLIAILITLSTINQAYSQKKCDVMNHYEDFISIEKSTYNETDYLVKRVIETQKKSCFSTLTNNNLVFMDYLLTNFSSNSNYQNLIKLNDNKTLRKIYFTDLKKDSLFNSIMNELTNKVIDKKVPKDNISMDQLLNIAVKYFSIMKLTDNGQYAGKVCVGLNDIKKTETNRKPFVEAFAFSSISKHLKSEQYSMYDEFVKAIKELYKLNLGIDKNEKLLRAQGAMFLLMRNNENLKQMLKTEYEKQKDFLPFILFDEYSN